MAHDMNNAETLEDFEYDNGDEDGEASDKDRIVSQCDDQRRRRFRDVIDSVGNGDQSSSSEDLTASRRSSRYDDMDPEYISTPDFVDVFLPEGAKKTVDSLDASPNGFDDISPSDTKVAIMPVEIDDHCYNMNHKNRGKCVVFNHEFFDTGFEDRTGTNVDAKRIEETFCRIGFEVEILDNLNHNEVIDKITQLSKDDHQDSDCICIFMLTHGLTEDVIWAKDAAYEVEKIWKPFAADNCLSLAGKPKLFFIQACRGKQLDSGVLLRRSFPSGSETDGSGTSYKIPSHADFLITHSTVKGFSSWRNPTEGTWFVECLCEVVHKYAETTDLLKMLTITARRIATKYSSFNDLNPFRHDKKQVPSITSMLLRDVYFTPK